MNSKLIAKSHHSIKEIIVNSLTFYTGAPQNMETIFSGYSSKLLLYVPPFTQLISGYTSSFFFDAKDTP